MTLKASSRISPPPSPTLSDMELDFEIEIEFGSGPPGESPPIMPTPGEDGPLVPPPPILPPPPSSTEPFSSATHIRKIVTPLESCMRRRNVGHSANETEEMSKQKRVGQFQLSEVGFRPLRQLKTDMLAQIMRDVSINELDRPIQR